MGYSNETPNYHLPQYIADDRPSYLGDWNEAMGLIDAGMSENKAFNENTNTALVNLTTRVANSENQIEEVDAKSDTALAQSNEANDGVTAVNDRIDAMEKTVLVCIGDSYLDGYTASGNVTPWGTHLAAKLGVTPNNFSHGGTGFATSNSGVDFTTLIDDAYSQVKDATLICIGGGYNDRFVSQAEMKNGVSAVIQKCAQYWPKAKICIFPMLWGTRSYTVKCEGLANAACEAVASSTYNAVCFSGCWTWNYDDDSRVAADYIHPNGKGQQVIASSMYECMNGSDPTVRIYPISTTVNGVTCFRDYLKIHISQGSFTGSSDDVILTLPENYTMQFSLCVGMGTISGSYEPVYLTAQNNEVKIFHAEGNVSANGYYCCDFGFKQS